MKLNKTPGKQLTSLSPGIGRKTSYLVISREKKLMISSSLLSIERWKRSINQNTFFSMSRKFVLVLNVSVLFIQNVSRKYLLNIRHKNSILKC